MSPPWSCAVPFAHPSLWQNSLSPAHPQQGENSVLPLAGSTYTHCLEFRKEDWSPPSLMCYTWAQAGACLFHTMGYIPISDTPTWTTLTPQGRPCQRLTRVHSPAPPRPLRHHPPLTHFHCWCHSWLPFGRLLGATAAETEPSAGVWGPPC